MENKTTQTQIQILTPNGETRLVQLRTRTITVGRQADNTLVLDDKKVSSQHLRLEVDQGQVRVIDLGSMNGTILGQVKLTPNQPQLWDAQQALQVGHHTLTLIRSTTEPHTLAWAKQDWWAWVRRIPRLGTLPGLLQPLLNHPHLRPWRPLLLFGAGLLVGSASWWYWGNDVGRTDPVPRPTPIPTFTGTPVGTPLPGAVITTTATVTPIVITVAPGAQGTIPSRVALSTLMPTATPRPALLSFAPALPAAAEVIQAAQAIAPDRQWDGRLQQLGVTLEDAAVAPGQPYWRLVKAQWQDEQEAAGRHHIYVEVLDQNGQRLVGQSVTVSWPDGAFTGQTADRAPPDYPYNYQMYAPGYSYSAQVEGLPSDIVHNLGLGDIARREMKIHTAFLLTFQRSTK